MGSPHFPTCPLGVSESSSGIVNLTASHPSREEEKRFTAPRQTASRKGRWRAVAVKSYLGVGSLSRLLYGSALSRIAKAHWQLGNDGLDGRAARLTAWKVSKNLQDYHPLPQRETETQRGHHELCFPPQAHIIQGCQHRPFPAWKVSKQKGPTIQISGEPHSQAPPVWEEAPVPPHLWPRACLPLVLVCQASGRTLTANL